MKLLVKAGRHNRRGCPVCVSLPISGEKIAALALKDSKGKRIAAQLVEGRCCDHSPAAGGCAPCITFLVEKMKAGEEREYTVEFAQRKSPAAIKLQDDKAGKVAITIKGKPFTTYRYEGNPARPCFFPLLGPGESQITRSWPISDAVPGETTDHKHHRSLWVAHGDVNGADNWSEEPNHGYQIHRGFNRLISGPVFGVLEAKNDWVDSQKKKVCEEVRRFTVYAQPDSGRLFDLEVTFFASEGDLRFGDTKEGGILAMRVATSMDGNHGGEIVNSYGGMTEDECWGKQAHWCDYSGPVGGQIVGITAMDHPLNLRYPVYWHVRNYGMYTANPFGLRDFYGDPSRDGSYLLPAGKSLRFCYRVYLHRGKAAEARSAERYHDYVNPPQVEVIA